MKKYTTTLTLTVSDENAPLIPMTVSFNGGSLETETPDQSVCRILTNTVREKVKNDLIVKHLYTYFGVAGTAKVESITALLDTSALEVVTTVEDVV